MKSVQPSGKPKKPAEDKAEDLAAQLTQRVVGQPAVSDIAARSTVTPIPFN